MMSSSYSSSGGPLPGESLSNDVGHLISTVMAKEVPRFLDTLFRKPYATEENCWLFVKSFVFFSSVYVLSHLLNRFWLLRGTGYTRDFTPSERIYWTGVLASGLNNGGFGIVALCLYFNQAPETQYNRLFGYNPRVDLLTKTMMIWMMVNTFVDYIFTKILDRIWPKPPERVDQAYYSEAGVDESPAAISRDATPTSNSNGGRRMNQDEMEEQIASNLATFSTDAIATSSSSRAGQESRKNVLTSKKGSSVALSDASTRATPDSSSSDEPDKRGKTELHFLAEAAADRLQTVARAAEADTAWQEGKAEADNGVPSTTTSTSTTDDKMKKRKKKESTFSSDELLFLFHHVASIILLTVVQYPFVQHHAASLIMWEISGPFLSYRIMALKFGWQNTSPKTFNVMQLSFFFSFVIPRLGIGILSVCRLLYDLSLGILFQYEPVFRLFFLYFFRPVYRFLHLDVIGGGGAGISSGDSMGAPSSTPGPLGVFQKMIFTLGGSVFEESYATLAKRPYDFELHRKLFVADQHLAGGAAGATLDVPLIESMFTFLCCTILVALNIIWGGKIIYRAAGLYIFGATKKSSKKKIA
ncbi:unnamed protein product [Amoebophrya sp. A25]|nr:unnamed protein product [Amoebophrya sp. A25]|eukprot:GSA25T00014005001.1